MSFIVKLENISKSYTKDKPVLHDFSLSVEAGESLAIMGPSGVGKTTLLSILGLLDTPKQGRYLFEQKEVSLLLPSQKAILRNLNFGFVFQTHLLIAHYTVLHNCCLPLLYRKVDEKKARKHAQEMLDALHLLELKNRFPHQLSGGQQQRVCIARALIGRPKIILADEPTSALDFETKTEILNLLFSLQEHYQFTLILVTHDPLVARDCDRILHLNAFI